MFNHSINPVFWEIGPFQIRYYGLIYVIGFFLGYILLRRLVKENHIHISKEHILDYIIALAFGSVIGARLFYCIVYNLLYYFSRPWEIIYIWQGGLSFHGGIIGASIAVILFCRKHKLKILQIADMTVIPLAIALSFGRIGNFINGELVGRLTTVAWCFEFPSAEGCRHPSQLYESIKNMFIFLTLWNIRGKKLKHGTLFGIFIVMYSGLRFGIEFLREPDIQLGLIFGMTMGQILSLIMLIFGSLWIYLINKHIKHVTHPEAHNTSSKTHTTPSKEDNASSKDNTSSKENTPSKSHTVSTKQNNHSSKEDTSQKDVKENLQN
jgi:phosphatidylglycerol---prolipoprotein diacylglyceryl transferase